jgi:hypothetical protein
MAWQDIHTQTADGVTIIVSKGYQGRKAIYTLKFGVMKTPPDAPSYLSPHIAADTVLTYSFEALIHAAKGAIQADEEKDNKSEADRIKALSAKPGSNIKPGGGVLTARDKNGPRATGKTAKKKAKLAARAEAARVSK